MDGDGQARQPSGECEPLAADRPVLSAVVFAYRNEDTIVRVVSSLVQQDCDEPFEVIVATSGGDRTGELVRQNFPGVHVIESPVRLMPGGARNLGMRVARGEMIAFLEGDCIARPGWIRNRVAAHRAGHEAVASTVAVANPEKAAARATAFLCYENRLEGSPGGPAGLPRSYGLSFTRDLMRRAGPFDETLRIEEDTLMAERLRELGVSAWFEPSVCIEHVGPNRLRDLFEGADRPRAPAGPKRHPDPRAGFAPRQVGIEAGIARTRGGREDGPARARAKPLPVAELEAVCDGPSRARRDGPFDRPRVDREHRRLGARAIRVRTNGGTSPNWTVPRRRAVHYDGGRRRPARRPWSSRSTTARPSSPRTCSRCSRAMASAPPSSSSVRQRHRSRRLFERSPRRGMALGSTGGATPPSPSSTPRS